MSTTLSFSPFPSDPVAIPSSNNNSNTNTNVNNSNHTDDEQAYKDMIKQLAAQAPEPYGAIPPLLKKKKKKRKSKKKKKVPIRRMSHVENWVAVDSKESIPDEEDLRHSSPFRNFLSTDFLVLPLHMPPPSLSATVQEEAAVIIPKKKKSKSDLRPVLFPVKEAPVQVIQIDNDDEEEDDEEEEDDDEEDDIEDLEDEDDIEVEDIVKEEDSIKGLSKKRSIPSFSQSAMPSTSTTKSYAMSSSPPSSTDESSKSRWMETIAQLRRSLTRSVSPLKKEEDVGDNDDNDSIVINLATRKRAKRSLLLKKSTTPNNNFIPMPPPPPRRNIRKRRSEATTQPRFNPETNTYTRDTRSNPDHLRMISAELNMMRSRKLSSPLKPRGFLPRRTDSFVRGKDRKQSLLNIQLE